MQSDIPPGWKLEAVSPPEVFLRGPTQAYREGWDRIFGNNNVLQVNLSATPDLGAEEID